jgi:hypothetical protein
MATCAVPSRRRGVITVGEAQVELGLNDGFAILLPPVASGAGPGVMRFGMTADTTRVSRKIYRCVWATLGCGRVTLHTGNALEHMSPMWKRRGPWVANAQDARARNQRAEYQHQSNHARSAHGST